MKRTLAITAAAVLALSLAFAYGPRFQNSAGSAGAARTGAGPVQAGTVFAGTVHDEAAALLGITPEELIALHQSGKTLQDIAVELGQNADAFRTALIDSRNQAIDEAVANGELTDAQGALMKTRSEAAVTAQLQREVGPNAGFAYGPARGAQAYGRQSGRAVGPAGSPGGYGAGGYGAGGYGPMWQNDDGAMPNGRMGRR
jgi:hypothetical protein